MSASSHHHPSHNFTTRPVSDYISTQKITNRPLSDMFLFHEKGLVGSGGSNGTGFALRSHPLAHSQQHASQRNSAIMLGSAPLEQSHRPVSEIILGNASYNTPEAEAIDRWFEDLSYYEKTLEKMAVAKLDSTFTDELQAMEQWFNVLTEPEQTTALFSLLQKLSRVQVRFFLTVLQQMSRQYEQVSGPADSTPSTTGESVRPISTSFSVGKMMNQTAFQELTPPEEDWPIGSGLQSRNKRLFDRNSASLMEEKYAQYVGDLRAQLNPSGVVASAAVNVTSVQPQGVAVNGSSSTLGMDPAMRLTRPAQEDLSVSLDQRAFLKQRTFSAGSAGGMSNGTRPSSIELESYGCTGSLTNQNASTSSLATNSSANPLTTIPERSGAAYMANQRPPALLNNRNTGDLRHATNLPLHSKSVQSHHGHHQVHMAPNDSAFGHDGRAAGLSSSVSSTSSLSSKDASSTSPTSVGETLGSRHQHAAVSSREKGKIPETIDTELVKDIPAWLRSLRLHKYTPIFEKDDWRAFIRLTEEDLEARGVAALGARRKMLKVFDQVKAELDAKGVSY